MDKRETERGKEREGKTEVLEGGERQIEAWGEREYKEFPPSWNTFSALGQKNAKMFHFLLFLPASVSLTVCFKMSSVPLWATADCFVPSSVICCRACVCGCEWELFCALSFVALACNELFQCGTPKIIFLMTSPLSHPPLLFLPSHFCFSL